MAVFDLGVLLMLETATHCKLTHISAVYLTMSPHYLVISHQGPFKGLGDCSEASSEGSTTTSRRGRVLG